MADKDFLDGVYITSMITLILLTMMFVLSYRYGNASHEFLGSKSGPCFANHTCRSELFCLHGDGAEPGTCVKK